MGKKSKKHKSKSHTKNGVADTESHKTAELPAKASALSAQYSASDLLAKAEEFIDVFQYDLARKFCQRALDSEPDNIVVLETYGFLELQDGNLDRAKQLFGRAIELQPDIGHSKYMYMGQMVTGQQAIDFFLTGIKLMKKSLAVDPSVQSVEAAAAAVSSSRNESTKQATPRDVSSAYCAIAEIYLTDACDEPDAEGKCKESLDLAVEADPTNPESYHTLASFWLCKGERQNAAEAMDKGVSLWLPQLRNATKPEGATIEDPIEVSSVSYPARIGCAKTLIELEKYEIASEILELLLDENDEIVEVWYLLGLLNYMQGADYKTNARHYLNKGIELAKKLRFDDVDMLTQMNQLLSELGPVGDDEEDEEEKDAGDGADDVDAVVDMDSESDDDNENCVTEMDH